MLGDFIDQNLGTGGFNYQQGWSCGQCGQWIYNQQWHQCPNIQKYYPQTTLIEVIKIMDNSGKAEKAISLLKAFKEKGILKIETADQMLDALDLIVKNI